MDVTLNNTLIIIFVSFPCILQFAMVEIINFFKFNTNYIHDTILGIYRLWNCIKKKYLSFVGDILSQTLRISFKIDIRNPYVIFPEHGSIQKYVYNIIIRNTYIIFFGILNFIFMQMFKFF